MPSHEDNEYVLRTTDDEIERLGFQHRVWSESAFALWERAGFGPGKTLLDVGCGPGFATFDLARLVGPSGRVVGFDASTRFAEYLQARKKFHDLPQIDVIVTDAQQLEYPADSADGAYVRWVLCFIPNPEEVIARIARALRPGGVLAVQDYVQYAGISLTPGSGIFRDVIGAVEKSVQKHGGDLNVASRVPGMMTRHGLELRETRPLMRSARPGSALWEWPLKFFRNYLPVLTQMKLLTEEQRAAFEAELALRSADESSVFLTPPMLEIIGVKR